LRAAAFLATVAKSPGVNDVNFRIAVGAFKPKAAWNAVAICAGVIGRNLTLNKMRRAIAGSSMSGAFVVQAKG
jgi:hypothetical protein